MSDKLREAFERIYPIPLPADAHPNVNVFNQILWEGFQAGHAHAIKFATGVIESHRVPIGNSSAGEMAREWTLDALEEVRDKINGASHE